MDVLFIVCSFLCKLYAEVPGGGCLRAHALSTHRWCFFPSLPSPPPFLSEGQGFKGEGKWARCLHLTTKLEEKHDHHSVKSLHDKRLMIRLSHRG